MKLSHNCPNRSFSWIGVLLDLQMILTGWQDDKSLPFDKENEHELLYTLHVYRLTFNLVEFWQFYLFSVLFSTPADISH